MNDRVGSLRLVDATRAEFDDSLGEHDLRRLAGLRGLETLQCSVPVKDRGWSLLNDGFFDTRPDVELRVYGHYSTECDLAFARRMVNVRRFAADCLTRARNVDAIGAMHLESLSLGIFELQDFSVLELVPPTLTTLSLGATRSKAPRVDSLRRFRSLKVLRLEGQANGIDALGDLPALEDLTLRSITTPDLRYLAPLPRLRSLDIKLGGIRSFGGIEGKDTIQYLELWQVRGLDSADIVGSLPRLQNVFLQSLPRIQALSPLRDAVALRRVVLESMKGLRDFTALKTAPALEEFGLVDGRSQEPEQLLPVLENPVTRRVSAMFGRDRKNHAFARLRDAHDKSDWDLSTRFEYR
jgi:hypothetical protein